MLRLLRKISSGADPFGYIDAATRARAKSALDRGDDCVLRLQVRQNGQLTGWAGQYDPETLQPAQGRAFELPAIVSQETVEMLRYLMSIEQPSAAQVDAIESAVGWLRGSQLSGWWTTPTRRRCGRASTISRTTASCSRTATAFA
jgi:PelA/Pel-15E family pectate lyase